MLPDADHRAHSEAELVARAQLRPHAGAQEGPVELGPVGRAEVDDGPAAVRFAHELRVAVRDAGVAVEGDLGVDVLHDAPPSDEELVALEAEDGHLVGGEGLLAGRCVLADDELERRAPRRAGECEGRGGAHGVHEVVPAALAEPRGALGAAGGARLAGERSARLGRGGDDPGAALRAPLRVRGAATLAAEDHDASFLGARGARAVTTEARSRSMTAAFATFALRRIVPSPC